MSAGTGVPLLGASANCVRKNGFRESLSKFTSWHPTCSLLKSIGNHSYSGEVIVIQSSLALATQPVDVSLVELVLVLSEITDDVDEIFSTVDHMIESGSIRLARRSIDDLMQWMPEA